MPFLKIYADGWQGFIRSVNRPRKIPQLINGRLATHFCGNSSKMSGRNKSGLAKSLKKQKHKKNRHGHRPIYVDTDTSACHVSGTTVFGENRHNLLSVRSDLKTTLKNCDVETDVNAGTKLDLYDCKIGGVAVASTTVDAVNTKCGKEMRAGTDLDAKDCNANGFYGTTRATLNKCEGKTAFGGTLLYMEKCTFDEAIAGSDLVAKDTTIGKVMQSSKSMELKNCYAHKYHGGEYIKAKRCEGHEVNAGTDAMVYEGKIKNKITAKCTLVAEKVKDVRVLEAGTTLTVKHCTDIDTAKCGEEAKIFHCCIKKTLECGGECTLIHNSEVENIVVNALPDQTGRQFTGGIFDCILQTVKKSFTSNSITVNGDNLGNNILTVTGGAPVPGVHTRPIETIQRVTLTAGSHVGNITFKAGKGEVVVEKNCVINGKVTGGELVGLY